MTFHAPFELIAHGAESGTYRMSLPGWNIVLRGGMAGAYIAMGATLMIIVSTGVAPVLGVGIAQTLMGFVFPLGIILTFLTGAELFTGDAMLVPFAASYIGQRKGRSIIRLLFLSYIGNLTGAIFFAGLVTYGVLLQPSPEGMTAGASAVTMVAFASERCSYPGFVGIGSCFIKAVAAGWLLNLAILLGICADDAIGKIAGMWFPSMALASTGLEHSITNAALIPAGLFCAPHLTFLQIAQVGPLVGNLSWSSFILVNLIPSSIGNLLGGMIFPGMLLWIAYKREMAQ